MNVLMLGAGVQSSALLEMALAGVLPQYDLVLFADTGNEPKAVYQHVTYLQKKSLAAGVDFRIVKGGDLLDDAMNGKFATMPLYVMLDGKRSILRRQCTANLKIEPTDLEVRRVLLSRGEAKVNTRGQIRVSPGVLVNKHLGISLDEQRRVSESRVKWQVHKFPLIDLAMNRFECLDWLRRYNCPVPPKSSCIVCPYHDDGYWLSLPADEFEIACAFDEVLRSGENSRFAAFKGELFLHPSCKPLRSLTLKTFVRPVQTSFLMELFDAPGCRSDAGFSCFS